MTQIIKIESQHPLLKPNILQMVKEELFGVVNMAIAKCYADLNQKVPDETSLTYLVNEVTDSIQDKFPSLRLSEIPVAFSNGIRHKYGDYFGLCVVSFEQFVQGYLDSPERVKLVEEKNKLVIEQRKEPTDDEKFDTAKGLSMEAHNLVAANKPVGLIGTAVYTFLNSLQLIHQDYKKGIMKEALDLLVMEKEKEISFCTDVIKRRHLNNELERLRTNIANDILTPDQHEDCKRVAKRQILTNWLHDLILDDTDVAQLVEAKRNFYKELIKSKNQ